jgi:hypothetical protein
MMNGDDMWRLVDDPASVQVLRDILTAPESAYDPEGWDGRLWADVVDPRTGDYRRDALGMLSDPMAESIIGMIRDGFLADDDSRINLSDERLSGIMRELEVDRDRITRILSVLEDERTKLQKR